MDNGVGTQPEQETGNEFTGLIRELSEGNVYSVCSKLKRLEDELLRSRAEVENVRRRVCDDVDKARKFSVENFASELLPVIDSLEAALKDSSNSNTIKDGVSLTEKQLKAVLEKHKILALEPLNEKFNPSFHQAISVLEGDEDDGVIVSVLQKGYTIWGRLLRPALVVVSKKKSKLNSQ